MMLSGNMKWSTKNMTTLRKNLLKNVTDEFQFSFIDFPSIFVSHYVISLNYFLGCFSSLQRRLNV